MNIVVVSPFLLGDSPDSGGGVSALGFLKSLAPRHNLHVIAFDQRIDPGESERSIREMEAWATSVRVVYLPITFLRKLCAKLLQLLLIPHVATLHSTATFRQACKETLAKYQIDLAIVQFPQMAQYVEEFQAIPRIMDVEDAYSVSSFRNYAAADSLPLPNRFYAALKWLGWVRHERRYYKKVDHVFVVSEQDDYGLRVFSPNLRITVLRRMMPPLCDSIASTDPAFDIGFIGSFDHEPNVKSLNFLFEDVLPQLVKQMPDLRVLVAGKNPPKKLVDRAPAFVKFVGFVPQVEDFYRQVRIVVAPLITGGGVKIKVIEGLRSGRSVVTTSIGAEGLGVTNGVNALIADDPLEFVAAIVKLSNNEDYRAAIGSAGQKHALTLAPAALHSEMVDEVFKSVYRTS